MGTRAKITSTSLAEVKVTKNLYKALSLFHDGLLAKKIGSCPSRGPPAVEFVQTRAPWGFTRAMADSARAAAVRCSRFSEARLIG